MISTRCSMVTVRGRISGGGKLAALIRASQTWRRVVISEFELKQLDELRDELDKEFKERTTVSKVQRASHERIYSKHGT